MPSFTIRYQDSYYDRHWPARHGDRRSGRPAAGWHERVVCAADAPGLARALGLYRHAYLDGDLPAYCQDLLAYAAIRDGQGWAEPSTRPWLRIGPGEVPGLPEWLDEMAAACVSVWGAAATRCWFEGPLGVALDWHEERGELGPEGRQDVLACLDSDAGLAQLLRRRQEQRERRRSLWRAERRLRECDQWRERLEAKGSLPRWEEGWVERQRRRQGHLAGRRRQGRWEAET